MAEETENKIETLTEKPDFEAIEKRMKALTLAELKPVTKLFAGSLAGVSGKADKIGAMITQMDYWWDHAPHGHEDVSRAVQALADAESAKPAKPRSTGVLDAPAELVVHSFHVKLKFIQPVLGTQSSNPDIQRDFISSKIPMDDMTKEELERKKKAEIDAIGWDMVAEQEVDMNKTVFPRFRSGQPFMYAYQVKGFCKESGKALYTAGTKLSAYQKKIDLGVFIDPDEIPLVLPPRGIIDECQRPLRAQTPQGERVALANSEMIPKGTTMEFDVVLFDKSLTQWVKLWFDYGKYHGMGQWRNSGKGKFIYSLYDMDGNYMFGTDSDHD